MGLTWPVGSQPPPRHQGGILRARPARPPGLHSAPGRVCPISQVSPAASGHTGQVFFFFSNRLGCLPSILLSLAVTAVLLLLLGVL